MVYGCSGEGIRLAIRQTHRKVGTQSQGSLEFKDSLITEPIITVKRH